MNPKYNLVYLGVIGFIAGLIGSIFTNSPSSIIGGTISGLIMGVILLK
jgi:uncharacterized membrane protein (UPF0136 family)